MNAELARLNEFQAKEDIPRDQATGPQIYKMMLVLTAHHGWCVSFSDVSRVFLHTSIKDLVFDVPPEEYQSQIPGGVGEMTTTVYDVDSVRLTFEPVAFWSKCSSVLVCEHMDDGALVGPDNLTDPARTTTFAHLGATTVLSRKISGIHFSNA